MRGGSADGMNCLFHTHGAEMDNLTLCLPLVTYMYVNHLVVSDWNKVTDNNVGI